MAEPIDASADSGAWTTRRRSALHRFARHVTHDPGLADDVLHDVLATVPDSGRTFPSAADEDRFVRRAIINRAIDLSRRRRSEATALHRWHSSHRDDTHAAEHPHDMAVALAELSPQARAVLALRFAEDLSYDDIAERLGGTPARHRMTVSRAIRKLRTLLTRTTAMNESPVNNDQTREEADNPDIVDALRAHYRDEDPAGSAGLVALVSPPRRRWWVGLGVAAAIILVAALVIPRFFDDRATVAEPPGGDEWVWIGHNGVQVEVPASWQFDTSHPCQSQLSPDAPHVRLGPDTGFNLTIGCTEGISDPPADQPPVVDFMQIDDGAPMPPIADRFPSKRVPGFVVRARWGQNYEDAHPQIGIVARRIVESATAITTIDNNGCPNRPTTLSSDLDGLPEPDSVAICQYRLENSTLRLWSSRQLLDRPAQELGRNLRALGTAPLAPGGQQCDDDARAMQVTLHVRSGTDERVVRVNYQGCSSTGIVTARGNPGMTHALCRQIFVMPTSRTGMAEPLAQRCSFPVPSAQPT